MNVRSLNEAMAALTGMKVEDVSKFIDTYENLLVLFTLFNGECQTAFGKVTFEQSKFWIVEQNPDIPRLLNHQIDDNEVAEAILSRIS